MLRDYLVQRPARSIYATHQLVYALVAGAPRPLFLPMQDVVVIRTEADLSAHAITVREIPLATEGSLVHVLLRASVETKTKGKRTYAKGGEKVFRSDWLGRRALAAGFEVVGNAEINAGREFIDKQPKGWWMDATVFVFNARITDLKLFQHAVAQGVGRTGKAFGFSMMVFNLAGEE